MKRCAIISYKLGIYELPYELTDALRKDLSKLANVKKVSKPHRMIAQWTVPHLSKNLWKTEAKLLLQCAIQHETQSKPQISREWLLADNWERQPIHLAYLAMARARATLTIPIGLSTEFHPIYHASAKYKFQLKLAILNFWNKFSQKGNFQSKTKKVNSIIEFCIFGLDYLPNLALNWHFRLKERKVNSTTEFCIFKLV